MEEIVTKGMLYERYGTLLNEHQRSLYEASVYHDLSLAEIAEEHGMSRQGVSDLLNRTTTTLKAYDEKLRLISKEEAIANALDELEVALRKHDSAEKKGRGAVRNTKAPKRMAEPDSIDTQVMRAIRKIRKAIS